MNIPEKYLIKDPSLLVAGQKLWSARWNEVTFINFSGGSYPITIKTSNGFEESHTEKGYYNSADNLPTLFLSCPYETNEFPKVMEVWNQEEDAKHKRVVLYKDELGYYAYQFYETMEDFNNKTNGSHIFFWQHARDITPVMPDVYYIEKAKQELLTEIESLKERINNL